MIGNSDYEVAKALPNPANDAKAIAQRSTMPALNRDGVRFNRELMRQVIAEFSARVAEKGVDTVALVYYAVHGVQLEGDNFLVPVDAPREGK